VCCSGCQLNPAYDEPSQSGGGGSGTTLASSGTTLASSGTAQDSSGTAQDSSGTLSPTGSGTAGEGVTGTSGATTETTGPPPGVCGDGLLDRGEACDDGNDANDDGCVSCESPRSCAEILALAPMSPSGLYKVDPGASGEPWSVTCDMDKDGGGWTGFSVQDTCNGHLESMVVALEQAESAGVDAECRPFTEKVNAGAFAYYWDISFPPSFRAFFLRGYEVQGLGDAELKYPQVLWKKAYEFPNGTLSLGNANDDGPLANWASDGGMTGPFFDGQILPYPAQELVFELGKDSDLLRIGWGEIGENPEGLYPWWSGQIFVR
jgi:cysteine-rich repeat protein